MTKPRGRSPRARATSSGAPARHVSFIKGHETFSQECDLRPISHRPGERLTLDRPAALRRSRLAPASSQHMRPAPASVDASWVAAADNAAEVEWARARDEIRQLAHRSMCAAEAGVRLSALLRRVPSLVTGELGDILLPDVEGGTGAVHRRAGNANRELLPLPLPTARLVS